MQRVCKVCRRRFRLSRSDAEFCSSQCRQSAYRARKKTSIEGLRPKAEDEKPYSYLADYRGYAAYLRSLARRHGANVRFMGTTQGILAVEETPGALAAARVLRDERETYLLMLRETKFQTTNREIVEAALEPQLGGSFMQRECEKECRDLVLSGVARQVSFFKWDYDYWLASAEPVVIRDWDRDDQPEGDDLSSDQVGELLAGGGYRVGKAP